MANKGKLGNMDDIFWISSSPVASQMKAIVSTGSLKYQPNFVSLKWVAVYNIVYPNLTHFYFVNYSLRAMVPFGRHTRKGIAHTKEHVRD